jgi:hypothetical protein
MIRTWHEVAVLWSLAVGVSGTLKTPAYRLATDYLFRLQKRLGLQYQKDLARYEEEEAAYLDAKGKAKKDGTDPGEPPEEPTEKIIFTTDTTIEALARSSATTRGAASLPAMN